MDIDVVAPVVGSGNFGDGAIRRPGFRVLWIDPQDGARSNRLGRLALADVDIMGAAAESWST